MSTTPELELFWISGSPYAWRVLLALELKRLPYRSRLLERSKGDLATPSFRELSPRGRVPVLRHGELVLTESIAIMGYLDDLFPEPDLFGTDPVERARVARAVSEHVSYLEPAVEHLIVAVYFDRVEERRAVLADAVPAIHDELRVLEGRLSAHDWLALPRVSAADLAAAPFVASLLRAAGKDAARALPLAVLPFADRFPAIEAWRRRIEGLPGYDRTVPPHWR